MHRAIVPTALIAIALGLSGCSGGSTDTKDDDKAALPEPQPRQCVAEEMPDENDTVPDFSTIVPCSEPHLFEIISVTPVPEEFMSGRTKKQKLARRAELATIGDDRPAISEQLRKTVSPGCQAAISEAAGLGSVKIAGKSAAEVGLSIPNSGANTWLSVSPPDLWAAGKTLSICSVRYSEGANTSKAKPVTSPDSAQLVTRMFDNSGDFPAALFACATDDNEPISCTDPHDAERFVSYDAKLAFGQDFARGSQVTDLPESVSKTIIDGCKDVMRDLDSEEVGKRQAVFANLSKKVGTDGDKMPVECALRPLDGAPQMKAGYLLD